ncbi:MAG: hypothetical protein WCJ39_06220 [bacterium]
MMRKKKLYAILGVGIVVLAGIFSKNISLQIGNGSTKTINQQVRTGEIALDTLQNITGQLLIFP